MLNAPTAHWANLDRLRVLAIIDIVMYHADYGRPRVLGGVGLPIFLIAAIFLPAQRATLPSWSAVTRPRLRRIGVPWLFWSAVYGLVAVGQTWAASPDAGGLRWADLPFEPWMVFYGTATHLWFLPFIFLAALAVRAVLPWVRRADWRVVAALGLPGGLGLACISPAGSLVYPFSTWWFSLPGVVLGLTLGRIALAERLGGKKAMLGSGLLAAGGIGWMFWMGLEPPVGRFAVAAALVVISMDWTLPDDPISRTLTRCVYGVYLIHPLIFVLHHRLIDIPSYPALVVVGLIGSTLATLILMRLPLLRATV